MVESLRDSVKRFVLYKTLQSISTYSLFTIHSYLLLEKACRFCDRLFLGAPAEIRTPDTLLKRQVLCLLSYWGIYVLAGMAGLEPTISESKSEVLPLHYIPPS